MRIIHEKCHRRATPTFKMPPGRSIFAGALFITENLLTFAEITSEVIFLSARFLFNLFN